MSFATSPNFIITKNKMAYTQKLNANVVILSAYLIAANAIKGKAVEKNNKGLLDEISSVSIKIATAKKIKPMYNKASSVPEL